jgi:Domain of unknown function (DUF3943)
VRRKILVLLSVVFLGAASARAQSPQSSESPQSPAPPVRDRPVEDQQPQHRVGHAFLQATIVNGFYELANLIRGQDTAKITPKTWWTNMKRGWEWDLDDFVVNQIGHPYQGNNYFNAGRANGLSFWESSAVTAFGSGTWEYFGETNQASLNDFINTTLGGIALGEMFHRTAWLVRNTHATGRSRMWNEIAAAAIDPITGANRFISGDASGTGEKPSEMVPSSLGAEASAGVLWRGSTNPSVEPEARPFFEADVLYGDMLSGRSQTPYDAFAVRLTFGGGSAVSEAQVRGRPLGRPLKNGAMQLTVSQAIPLRGHWSARVTGEYFDRRTFYQTEDRSKAFGLGLASGWEWRVSRHFGAQALGALHVAALGDLELARGTVENVMGNFWSAGAAIVVR